MGWVCLFCVVLDVMPIRVLFWVGTLRLVACLKTGSLGRLLRLLAVGLSVACVW